MCLESLFKALNSLNSEDGYCITWYNKKVSFNALAYEDNLLIISESAEGMNKLLNVCNWFFKYSNLVLAASKSCSVGNIWQYQNRCSLNTTFVLGNMPIPWDSSCCQENH